MRRRADTLFELADAITSTPTPVTDIARLSPEPEQEHGHGGVYDSLNAGRTNHAHFQEALAATPIPTITGPDGRNRIVLAVDVSNWLRSDAATSPDRSFCHTYARGRGRADMIPGWPYSFVVALEAGPASWTAILSARRLHPDEDATIVTATQLRTVVENLITAGHHHTGDPRILIIGDAGYDLPRLAWLLANLPIEVLGRVRSDRVYYGPAGSRAGPTKGRAPRHGKRLSLQDADTQTTASIVTDNETDRYGYATARAYARMHPKLGSHGQWANHASPTPIIEGTLIHLQVERLPGDRHPKPVWLWVSTPAPAGAGEVDLGCDVLPQVRYRAHVRVPQAATRVDEGAGAGAGGSGSMDKSDRDRVHPTPPCSWTCGRLSVAVAVTTTGGVTHSVTGACGLSAHPPDAGASRGCAESVQTKPRTHSRTRTRVKRQYNHSGKPPERLKQQAKR